MRVESCSGCAHFDTPAAFCRHHGMPTARIRGCSHSRSGKAFFDARKKETSKPAYGSRK